MTNQDVTFLLLRGYELAQALFGRVILSLQLQQQRLRADCLAHGSALLKRTLDILASFLALVFLSPLFGLIALCVWIEDGGSVFFSQIRVGKNGRLFKMYKVRSM